MQDLPAVKDSPGIYWSAVRDAVPWTYMLAVLGDVLLLGLATYFVLRKAAPADGPAGLSSAPLGT